MKHTFHAVPALAVLPSMPAAAEQADVETRPHYPAIDVEGESMVECGAVPGTAPRAGNAPTLRRHGAYGDRSATRSRAGVSGMPSVETVLSVMRSRET